MKTINHNKLNPGIYLASVQKVGLLSKVYTYDIRFKKPNNKENKYITGKAAHSIEHIMAEYFRKNFPEDTVYVGPMGCLTGFYIVSKSKPEDFLNQFGAFLDVFLFRTAKSVKKNKDMKSTELNIRYVPFSTSEECGNSKFHDVLRATEELEEFRKVISNQCHIQSYDEL